MSKHKLQRDHKVRQIQQLLDRFNQNVVDRDVKRNILKKL